MTCRVTSTGSTVTRKGDSSPANRCRNLNRCSRTGNNVVLRSSSQCRINGTAVFFREDNRITDLEIIFSWNTDVITSREINEILKAKCSARRRVIDRTALAS